MVVSPKASLGLQRTITTKPGVEVRGALARLEGSQEIPQNFPLQSLILGSHIQSLNLSWATCHGCT